MARRGGRGADTGAATAAAAAAEAVEDEEADGALRVQITERIARALVG